MRDVIPRFDRQPGIDVLYAPLKGAGHFGGLQACKSVWLCPVCAAKISERRREELSEGLRNWAEQGKVVLVTFTLQHTAEESLQIVLGALKAARARLVSGRGAKDLAERYGVVGTIRALELTHGLHGWHPHMHVLMFLSEDLKIIPFEEHMKARWGQCVAAGGRYASWQHGCDVRFSDQDISAYVSKWGKEPQWTNAHEMTKAVVKQGRQGGRTPTQLLSDYLDGDEGAGRRWLEYAVNLKGERQLWWSQGLRDRLGLGAERTDEEIAVEEEEIAVLLCSLSVQQWRAIIGNDARGELLEVASSGDSARVESFLRSLGVSGLALAG